MTVLITGASGHIGGNLVRSLIDRGQSTRCLVHMNTRSIDGLDTEKVTGDIRDPESLYRAFQGIDTVFHLAGHISINLNSWEDLRQTNILGTRNVVDACLKAGVRRLVYFSSIHAFKHLTNVHIVDETGPLVNGDNSAPYDRSKAAGTREVRNGIEKGLDAVIVHPTAVIGPYDFQPSFLGEALLMMARGKLPALVPGGYDWVDVRDVVKGTIAAAEKAPTGSAYLLSGNWVSLCDMVELIGELVGRKMSKFVCPMWLAQVGAVYFQAASKLTGKQPLYTSMSLRTLAENRNVNHEKATRELGYQPRPLRDTLEDTLHWFHENGKLDMGKTA